MVSQALSGLKVIEYGQFVSAPYCTKMMADLGAEVIKVEEPGSGDECRRYGPFPDDIPHPERSGLFLYLNSNKLGITLNLRTATGRRLLKELLRDADAFVENNPLRAMKALGLDYPSLKESFPCLIMTSITPFGHSGPYRDYKGDNLVNQAAGGISAVLGSPRREPLTFPLCAADFQGAMSAAAATLVALFARDKTGRGQHVDISDVRAMATLQYGMTMARHIFQGTKRLRVGHRGSARFWPYSVLPCKDGYMSIMSLEDYHWKKFAELAGFGWAKDPRFETQVSRAEYEPELDSLINPWMMAHTKEEIFDLCFKNNIPFMPVWNAEDLLETEQFAAREYWVEVEHPQAGAFKYPGAPAKLSRTPWKIGRRAPLLGEHNEDVLCQRLGYSRDDLADMRRAGII